MSKNDKMFLLYLLFFSIFIAAIETIGVAIIMPFISVASDFNIIETNKYYKQIYDFFNFTSNVDFVIFFGMSLIFFYIMRSIFNLSYFYMLSKFSKGRTHLLSYKLFENYLGFSYREFIKRNSSELAKTIINETQYLTIMISAVLLMLSEVFVLIFIYIIMLYVSLKITLVMTLILLVNALFLVKTISKKIKTQGKLREEFQKKFYEVINSTFGNFKMIKLQSNDKIIIDKFSKASYGFAKSNIISETLSHFPRLFLETIGFGLVASIVIYFIYKNQTDISDTMGILSMFILGLYRLMPSVNRLLTGYNQIQYYYKSLDIIHHDLSYDGEGLGDENIEFSKKITLKNLSFEYVENKKVLGGIELDILKGDKIAFIGPSGSGKSTIVDIIMGLYKPTSGTIHVDDRILKESNIKSWRKKIGYIPQQVYLFDGTVAQNVSFGLEYDELTIKKVLKKAKILDFLETDQDGINTFVGEGGVKLSGGQKQRVAIARALYGNPEILVLDEATSALDEKIEKEIMKEIYEISIDKTLLIIAHRLSTIKNCNKVYKIENNSLVLVVK